MRAFQAALVTAGLFLALMPCWTAEGQPLPLLPDPKLTPGDTLDVSREDLCVPGYTKHVRDVPSAVKRQVYALYGIKSHRPREYEVDHLISLELGGSNSVRNLWPQSYLTKPWNAHVKDALENRLHALVCSGELDLKTAQRDIATDWIAAYKKYVGARSSSSAAAPHAPVDRGQASIEDASDKVWVNLNSGVFWREGTRYYGRTKHGKFMPEAEALRQGYHAAGGT